MNELIPTPMFKNVAEFEEIRERFLKEAIQRGDVDMSLDGKKPITNAPADMREFGCRIYGPGSHSRAILIRGDIPKARAAKIALDLANAEGVPLEYRSVNGYLRKGSAWMTTGGTWGADCFGINYPTTRRIDVWVLSIGVCDCPQHN